ncbi:hypothetical protein MesoLjLa_17420 [Mesorhizobium sp. L-2-11]|nr:hypothetical protein MesoLjLa_17420 [Mesorhizobium sp. L-2-11]
MQSVYSVTYLSGSDTGHFSPYSDGEKDAFAKDFANLQRCRKGADVAASPLLPVHGEKMPAGR